MGSHLRRATSYEKDDQKGRKIPTRHSNEVQVDTCVIPNATATSRCADWVERARSNSGSPSPKPEAKAYRIRLDLNVTRQFGRKSLNSSVGTREVSSRCRTIRVTWRPRLPAAWIPRRTCPGSPSPPP